MTSSSVGAGATAGATAGAANIYCAFKCNIFELTISRFDKSIIDLPINFHTQNFEPFHKVVIIMFHFVSWLTYSFQSLYILLVLLIGKHGPTFAL